MRNIESMYETAVLSILCVREAGLITIIKPKGVSQLPHSTTRHEGILCLDHVHVTDSVCVALISHSRSRCEKDRPVRNA